MVSFVTCVSHSDSKNMKQREADIGKTNCQEIACNCADRFGPKDYISALSYLCLHNSFLKILN